MDENFERKAEKREWPNKNEYGLPEGIRVFILLWKSFFEELIEQFFASGSSNLAKYIQNSLIRAFTTNKIPKFLANKYLVIQIKQ